MAARLDDDECPCQLRFAVELQHFGKFGMYGVLRRRQHTQIENCAALSIRENDSPEIPVSGDEDAVLRAGDFKQFLVRGP